MAKYTSNIGLKKPDGTDYVLVGDLNANMDVLDGKIGKPASLQTVSKGTLVDAINEAAQNSQHQPKLQNGHWWVWDASKAAYVDTGVQGDISTTQQKFENAEASTETLSPGNDASVTLTDDGTKKIFHFEIPRGEKGETGSIENLTINGKAAENGNVTLTAEDIGAATPADVGQVADKLATYVRPNLLDNWYFVNPVNQRGFTSGTYGGSMYSIDRWRLEAWAGAEVAIGDGITISNNADEDVADLFYEVVDMDDILSHKVTASVLCTSVVGEPELRILQAASPWAVLYTTPLKVGITKITTLGSLEINGKIRIELLVKPGTSATAVAAKLELGDTQTLAHQDADGNWVLNEIPDYGEQLARCQRYFVRIHSDKWAKFGNGRFNETNAAELVIPLPVTMRNSGGNPSCAMSGSFYLSGYGGWYSIESDKIIAVASCQFAGGIKIGIWNVPDVAFPVNQTCEIGSIATGDFYIDIINDL